MTNATAAAPAIRGVSRTYPDRVFGGAAPAPGSEPAAPEVAA